MDTLATYFISCLCGVGARVRVIFVSSGLAQAIKIVHGLHDFFFLHSSVASRRVGTTWLAVIPAYSQHFKASKTEDSCRSVSNCYGKTGEWKYLENTQS